MDDSLVTRVSLVSGSALPKYCQTAVLWISSKLEVTPWYTSAYVRHTLGDSVTQRRCRQYDENYPENNLIFFPTEESWTPTTRPQRLPHSDRFPPRYAATPCQQTERPARKNASKPQNRQRKPQATQNAANQSTMDQYIAPGSTQRHLNTGTNPNMNPADAAAPTDPTLPSLDLPDWGAEPHPQGWN